MTTKTDAMDALDLLCEDTNESEVSELIWTSEKLQELNTKRVVFAPDGAEYLGSYFAPYHDVSVYLGTDGVYYSVWFSIGD